MLSTNLLKSMNSYYFKIDSDIGRELYCEFEAESYERAVRNLLFCCFYHKYEERFKNIKDADTKCEILLDNLHRIKEVSLEEFNQYYPLQLD